MPLLEDITLSDTVTIRATPEKIFGFFMDLENRYKEWHPRDHVLFKWLSGKPWEPGSVAYAEEYLHGKLHKLKFRVSRVVPGRELAYEPVSRIIRFYFPENRFILEPEENNTRFTATVRLRVGKLAKLLAGKKLAAALDDVRRHMREEGENLKKIMEG